MRGWWAIAVFAVSAPAAFGQLTLTRILADEEKSVGAVVDVGSAYPSEAIAAKFRVRNNSAAAAAVTTLGISGAGFVLSGAPKLPVGLAAGEAFDFSVVFQATAAASYSATLATDGVSLLVTATVQPGLTNSLTAAGIAFGTVEAGGSATRRVTLSNLTGYAMPAPLVTVTGDAFALTTAPGGGTVVPPGDSAGFDVVFQPAGVGTWSGKLAIGDRTYPLTGTAIGAPLPKPILSVELTEAKSGLDGSVSVAFDAPARTAGAGTLTLSFDPLVKGATDPAIQLGVVGRSLPFTIAPGDTRIPAVNFRTGTTAGTITLAVELGGATDRKTVVIPAAPVSIGSVTVTRAAGAIEVRISGFDKYADGGEGRVHVLRCDGDSVPGDRGGQHGGLRGVLCGVGCGRRVRIAGGVPGDRGRFADRGNAGEDEQLCRRVGHGPGPVLGEEGRARGSGPGSCGRFAAWAWGLRGGLAGCAGAVGAGCVWGPVRGLELRAEELGLGVPGRPGAGGDAREPVHGILNRLNS